MNNETKLPTEKLKVYEWFDSHLPDHMYPDHKVIAKVWGPRILWKYVMGKQREITHLETALREAREHIERLTGNLKVEGAVMDYNGFMESQKSARAWLEKFGEEKGE